MVARNSALTYEQCASKLRFLLLLLYIGRSFGRPVSDDLLNPGVEPKIDPLQRADRYQGDIVLIGDKKWRNAIKDANVRWKTKTIPYIYAPGLTQATTDAIQAAIADYHKYTCIKLIPRTKEADYVQFFSGDGCYSYVGRAGGRQPISIGQGCEIKGIAIHEIMHTLGFYHEQSRSDRDQYVTINWNNIYASYKDQFDKEDTNNLGIEYDYSSVMHYPAGAFSLNGKDTIVPKVTNVKIGQRKGFSIKDAQKINTLYDCGDMLAAYLNPTDSSGSSSTASTAASASDDTSTSTTSTTTTPTTSTSSTSTTSKSSTTTTPTTTTSTSSTSTSTSSTPSTTSTSTSTTSSTITSTTTTAPTTTQTTAATSTQTTAPIPSTTSKAMPTTTSPHATTTTTQKATATTTVQTTTRTTPGTSKASSASTPPQQTAKPAAVCVDSSSACPYLSFMCGFLGSTCQKTCGHCK